MKQEIGGYFELELTKQPFPFPHQDGRLVNSGRNALMLILKHLCPSRIYVPYYTCNSVLEPLLQLNIPYTFYSVTKELEITGHIDLQEKEYLLYTNYFGVREGYIRNKLIPVYSGKLILDNSQSLFSPVYPDIPSFFSPRKFVGIPDGGIACCENLASISGYPEAVSTNHFSHLIKRIESGAGAGYEEFQASNWLLSGRPIEKMSKLTNSLLASVDFESIKEKRIKNYRILQKELESHNELTVFNSGEEIPMVYPFLHQGNKGLREVLIKKNVFIARYWPNVMIWCKDTDTEYYLCENLLPLPLDQRYGVEEMNFVLSIIKSYYGIR